jgi:hypothetical protein
MQQPRAVGPSERFGEEEFTPEEGRRRLRVMSRRGRNRRAKRIDPKWMLVRGGAIQNIIFDALGDGRMLRCIPLFHSYDDARSFIDEDYWATGARPCEIGSLQSEPDGLKEDMNTVIAGASLFDHCEYAVVMVGTDSESNIRWRAFDIRPEALGLSSGPDLA